MSEQVGVEDLQQQVDKLKQDALEDAEWAEACDVRNDTLQQQLSAEQHTVLELAEQLAKAEQQVESLKGALADAVQRCGYGDAEILRLRAVHEVD